MGALFRTSDSILSGFLRFTSHYVSLGVQGMKNATHNAIFNVQSKGNRVLGMKKGNS